MLLVTGELPRDSLDLTIGNSILAFGAVASCALESRAAIAMAGEILTDRVNEYLTEVASRREAINCGAYLPPAWQIGLDGGVHGRHGKHDEVRDERLDRSWLGGSCEHRRRVVPEGDPGPRVRRNS